MTTLSGHIDLKVRRHDLVFVSPVAWRSLMHRRDDLAQEPLLPGWVDRGWPLVARRAMPAEEEGVALGLPLPPFAGKRRVSVLMQPEDIVSTAPPLELGAALGAAPEPWRQTLTNVASLAFRQGMEARIFGSLSWQMLTELDYLTADSDLDLLLPFSGQCNLAQLTADIALVEAAAPMRLDGELVRGDGAAVNWRELHTGAREVLVKTIRGVVLLDANHFINGGRLQ
ncbi:malonate decarboxylase holo-[acyl-carrier-protein] synthase [Mesorhizobium sp. WSM4307]|uniref:malonate decarboxylase holo-[acyl-carrier-protein] synthase n=1 Tax=unclassified Mesorhizobium TaxID=325217 RepID=UPI000BAF90C6|nr:MULTISPECIES: malonate decarboxylase holo-[acyl-carrier-protein] synthase [unclassified Mesorhizobium]PBB24375.1 malonate decarboxylase holo-[acyl-carrier-protein] synthase [Mesorhizobium sp. WSM4304]PBB74657.1 malonate decarboxylase holo-[acyl-carrier-protein] synthase [Mesorhizobium sp. WSM4308]TRC71649.1 malonate decarboxylase holo-[acyl-carrier-protein] synthase [Mesorhizobium sp. WSM4315]TRC83453.1 malonate decarboxylase holo-[acyl-carrier-protein] synthase [Mesorhizobium sp. WSM4307]